MIRTLRHLISDVLRHRIEQLTALRTSSSPEADLIHEIRVAAKQCRAQLRLIRNPAHDPFCDRHDRLLARAARSLAADRDLLVFRETLERLARKCDRFGGRDSMHRIILHLREQRVDRGLRASAVRDAFTTVMRSARAIRLRLRQGPADALLMEAFRNEYRRARRLSAKCRGKPGPDTWHRWRKQIKALHYQAASLAAIRPQKLGRLARRCWRLQALLGRHHDLHLARERLGRMRIDPINEPCRVRARHVVDRELARLEGKVKRTTKTFLRHPSKTFAARLKRSLNA